MNAGINRGRVRILGYTLRVVGVEPILRLEESDPQYIAVSRVASRTTPGYASVTAVLTALVSYKLAMRGEEWWSCYSTMIPLNAGEHGLEDAGRSVIEFIKKCRGSIIQRKAKIGRVEKALVNARHVLERLLRDPQSILYNSGWLLKGLAKALNAQPYRKTIVFSAKMAYYAAKTIEPEAKAPIDAPIPVDLRVSCVTTSSGLISIDDYRKLLRVPLLVISAWEEVSKISGVPQLNIDSLVWITGRAPMDYSIGKARIIIADRLRPYLQENAGIIAEQLAYTNCAKK